MVPELSFLIAGIVAKQKFNTMILWAKTTFFVLWWLVSYFFLVLDALL